MRQTHPCAGKPNLLFLLPLAAGLLAGVGGRADAADVWAFEETFDGNPATPSQSLLPRTFDYTATHRTHPATINGPSGQGYGPFPAEHGPNCEPPPATHMVMTDHVSNGANPDQSFFICKDHMMSSMGQVEGYSVSAFWPKQEFDFAGGGVLEFDVNLDHRGRQWWEVMIVPKEQTQLGAARDWLPISETYPKDRIVLIFEDNNNQKLQVGKGAPSPQGMIVDTGFWANWTTLFPNDPALTDHRIRRKMRIELEPARITWKIQKEDGTFHSWAVDVPGGLPMTRGLVFFKTHAYTPDKADNFDRFTFHWDNIRFTGPRLPAYENFEAEGGIIYLEANGNRRIGDTASHVINLPKIGPNPVLLGQTHGGLVGQVLLSINGGPNLVVQPHSVSSKDNPCHFGDWRTFRVPLPASQLRTGANTLKWTVGTRTCGIGEWFWDGFSVKGAEIQFDGTTTTPPPNGKAGDLNFDGVVNVEDLSIHLRGWIQYAAESDVDKDGDIDVGDLSQLLQNWG